MIDRGARERAALAYVAALASHDVAGVRLAPGCRRRENGLPTGRSGPAIVDALATSRTYRVIRRVEVLEHLWHRDLLEVRFQVHVVGGWVAPVRERFGFDAAGDIERITARIGFPRRQRG